MATVTAPTYQDFFNAGRAQAQLDRPDLSYDEGDISEMETAGAAAMADHLAGYTAQRVRETFLDGAAGDALTTLADDRYNIQRNEATLATGVVTLTRVSGTLTGTLPAGTVFATEKDSAGHEIQFVLDDPLGWGSGTLTQDASVTAKVAGTDGNVAAATVVRVISTGLFDTFTVTNASRMAGGLQQEDDEALRQRCREFTQTLRRGTLAALEYGAKQVGGVYTASAVEPGDGTVSLYVADSSGSSSPTMIQQVQVEIEKWRSGGIVVNVYGGALYTIGGGITLSLTTRPGVVSSTIAGDIKKAIVARVNKLKIGESLSATLIKNAVATVDPDGILDVEISNPVGTVNPGANGLIRVTVGEITVS